MTRHNRRRSKLDSVFLRWLPGFRTGHRWKQVLATLVYLYLLLAVVEGLATKKPVQSAVALIVICAIVIVGRRTGHRSPRLVDLTQTNSSTVPTSVKTKRSHTLRVAPRKRGHFNTIQAAINAAGPGTTISIEPGQYVERVHIDRNVELVAPNGGVSVDARVGHALSVATDKALVTGLNFRSWDPTLPAVWCGGGSLQLSECTIWAAHGIGLEAKGAALALEHVDVTSDLAVGVSVESASLKMTKCTLERCGQSGFRASDSDIQLSNVRISHCGGNGLYLFQSVTGSITDSDITECKLPLVFAGGGVVAQLRNCSLHDSADLGVTTESRAQLTLSECDIRGIRGNCAAVYARQDSLVRLSGGSLCTSGFGVGADGARIEATDTLIDRCRFGVVVTDKGDVHLAECKIREPETVAIRCIGGVCRIEEVTIEAGDCSAAVVFVGESGELGAKGLTIEGGLDAGLLVHGHVQLENSYVRGAAKPGISVENGGRLAASNVVISSTLEGVTVGSVSTANLCDVRISESLADGIRAVGVGSKVIVRDVRVEGTGGNGLTFEDRAGGDIIELTVDGCGGDGVHVNEGCEPRLGDIKVRGQRGVAICAPATAPTQATGIGKTRSTHRTPAGRTSEGVTNNVEALRAELDQLVGLAAVKRDLSDVVDFIELERRQKEIGLTSEPISRHLIFAGPPGTGKTTIARLYAELLTAMGVLSTGQLVEVGRSNLVSEHIGGTAQLTTQQFMAARGGVLFIDEAYSLTQQSGTTADFGIEAINTLVKLMEDYRSEVVVIAAGYTAEMEKFRNANPGLASRFSRTIHFDSYTVDELVEIFRRRVTEIGLRIDESDIGAVRARIAEMDRTASFGNARVIRDMIDQGRVAMARRLAGHKDLERDELITFADVDFREVDDCGIEKTGGEGVRELLKELDAMVGLSAVKGQVADLINVLKLQEEQREAGLRTRRVNPHLVFAGSAGTGKTTVARLYGRILAALGLLRDGHVVEVGREGLVAGYVGQTAIKTTEKFAEARGGILFIDEAYDLAHSPGASEDFGREAITTLVKLMEDHRSDVVVIVAGYTDEMSDFIAANPGLESRFSKTIMFEDYSDSELLKIFCDLAKHEGYSVEPEAGPVLLERFAAARSSPHFGNGRFARNLLENEVITTMARRLSASDSPRSGSELSTIIAEDVRGD